MCTLPPLPPLSLPNASALLFENRLQLGIVFEMSQEMGVEASQARVRHYLESRTIGGRDVIDPTGLQPLRFPHRLFVTFCQVRLGRSTEASTRC
jgi:hypothetical protein